MTPVSSSSRMVLSEELIDDQGPTIGDAMRRPVLILTLLSALAAPLAPVPAAAATTGATAPAVRWAPCAEDAAVDCGTLTVPVDWNDPRAGTFELALARRRASDPAARIGSLVINPGGPGGSGVDAVVNDWLGFTRSE